MTDSEKQIIIDEVLSKIRTNSRTINQLTPITSLNDTDYFEVSGGRRVSYSTLAELISSLSEDQHSILQAAIERCDLSSASVTATDTIATLSISSYGKTITATIPIASDSKAGLITPMEKAKIANVYTKSETDAKVATKADAVETAQALLLKADKTYVDGKVSDIEATLNSKANKAEVYTKAETDAKVAEWVAALVDGAPETLDTLKEVADALESNEEVVDALNAAITNKADKADTYTKEQVNTRLDQKMTIDGFNEAIYGRLSNADVERMRKRGVVIIHGYGAQWMDGYADDGVYLIPPVDGRTTKAYVQVGASNWYGYTYGSLNEGNVAKDGYYIDRYSSILYKVTDGLVERLSIQNQALMLDEWNTASIEALERDLAQYSEETPITLYTAQSGKYVDLGGHIQSASGWAISERVRLKKGYTYLYKPSNNQPIAQGVALVSRITTETTSVLIDYTYTYDSQGRIATATADYNGAVYTYTYDEDDVPTITDSSANVVPSLPMVRVVEANERVAMFKSLSNEMPKSGYYAILCNEDCEAEVSAPAPLGELRVVSYGFIRSIVNQKEDKAVVKQLQEKVEALDTTVNHGYPRSFYEALAVDCIGKCRVYVLCRAGGAVTLRLEPLKSVNGTWTPSYITKKASKHHDTILCFDVPSLNKLPDFQHPYGIFSQYGVGAYGTNATDLIEVMALWVGGGMTNAHYLLQGAATSNLVVDHWDTEDVTDICRIFSYGLRSPILDLTALTFKPNVQVSGANDQPAAMRNMHGVEVVYLPDDFAVNSPFKAGLFAECTDLKDFSMVENMNLSGTTDVRKLVAGCTKLERIDLSRWDTSTLQLLNSLFEGCTKLKEITFGWTDTERFVNIGSLISNTAVEEIDMAWDVPNCTSAVPNLPSTIRRANMRGLKTSKMTIPNYFASGCSRLTDIDVTDWDTSNRVGFYTMFYNCKSLESLDLSSWSNENVTTYSNWIRGSGLKFITVSQKFFLGKLAIDYNLSTLGFADSAKTTSNGWLEHIASTAPTIRSKEGYGEDPEIPLLEEENGEWYINDGVGRSLQLASNLKNKSWAAQYIALLNAKGYTIS